jgi:hypothetical protein
MTDTKYNGWTNYATWRVQLEIFDDLELELDQYITEGEEPDAYTLKDELQQIAEDAIFDGGGYDERRPSNLMEDYARAFLSDVNWYELAEHMLADYVAEQTA